MSNEQIIKAIATVWTESGVEVTLWPGDKVWIAQDLDEETGDYRQTVVLPLYELLDGLAQLLKKA